MHRAGNLNITTTHGCIVQVGAQDRTSQVREEEGINLRTPPKRTKHQGVAGKGSGSRWIDSDNEFFVKRKVNQGESKKGLRFIDIHDYCIIYI